MIVYDLQCGHEHRFEAWFGSAADYEAQLGRGLVSCPVCNDGRIEKAVMAPAVSAKSNQSTGTARRHMQEIRKLRAEVEARCDYVGNRFAEEARRRHAEGNDSRGVFGEATLESAIALLEDGIPVAPLPFRPRQTSDA